MGLLNGGTQSRENWAKGRASGHVGGVSSAAAVVPPARRHPWDSACALAAWLIPLALAIWRSSPTPQWRDDLAVVQGLGLVPIGSEHLVSSVLTAACALLPIGGRLLRAALPSALALALAAALVYRAAQRLLEANTSTPRLTPPLAMAAALVTTLSPSAQLEATIAGGATPSFALLLAGAMIRSRFAPSDARGYWLAGVLAGATFWENHAAGTLLLAILVVQMLFGRGIPTSRAGTLFAVGAASSSAVLLAPLAIRALFAAHAWVDLGQALSNAGAAASSASSLGGMPGVWQAEIGVLSFGLGAFGALWGMLQRGPRADSAWLLVPVVLDFVQRHGVSNGALDAISVVRMAALASIVTFAALGLQTAALLLRRARVPMAGPAAVLLVVFDLTLVPVAAEDSAALADRRLQSAAEVWTDEALGSLPPGAVVVVRSPTVAWRLWASSIVRGERPDVLVAPLMLLKMGSVTARLLAAEPALGPIIRDMAMSGRPSEFALSSLSDLRPLFVEFDPSWDERLLPHLLPHPFWMQFAAHPLGRSDRKPQVRSSRVAFRRVLAAAKQPVIADRATLDVLDERASEQAVILAALGDREQAAEIVRDLRALDPDHPRAAEISARLEAKRPRIDVAALLP